MESLQQRVRWPRQLVRMQQAIHGEPDAARADCLRAEHASLLARHGFQSQAEEALLELRKRYENRPHPKVTAWINLADAIVEGRTGDPSGAAMKLRRAHALAKACANAPMQALAAAWLAHELWNAYDVAGAVGFAREALRTAAPDDHKARARASLVVAEIFALSAQDARARTWFASARRHAVIGGDDASKIALSFNLSVVHGMLLRQARLSSQGSPDARSAELHRVVSENVDAALGVADDELAQMERARLLSLLDRVDESLELYRRHRLADANRVNREWPIWLADEAWCLCRKGEIAEAVALASAAEALLHRATLADDLACVHSLLAKVCAAAEDPTRAAFHAAAADASWRRYAEYQAHCAGLCESITENG